MSGMYAVIAIGKRRRYDVSVLGLQLATTIARAAVVPQPLPLDWLVPVRVQVYGAGLVKQCPLHPPIENNQEKDQKQGNSQVWVIHGREADNIELACDAWQGHVMVLKNQDHITVDSLVPLAEIDNVLSSLYYDQKSSTRGIDPTCKNYEQVIRQVHLQTASQRRSKPPATDKPTEGAPERKESTHRKTSREGVGVMPPDTREDMRVMRHLAPKTPQKDVVV
ncbi:uncharacterized protein BJ212DRAFT_1583771 [Suillus subaureus]|uniref:Uncharacterized protein n=1 Tax=Suillus subaureus TaxID=48587 RepID=A0A9P7EPG1_9AGAM|nr:uncharacterized protein BJ212DRAFT_1583771 [Suillus subaureus]KAG1827194.1 hypothetical protein BJ212DRAFT_1583771 [Suillus subaureus]